MTREERFVTKLFDSMAAWLKPTIEGLEARLDAIEGKGIKYAGVWQRALDYRRGDVVTHDGNAWVAIAEQTRATPGDTNGWQLLVKGAGR